MAPSQHNAFMRGFEHGLEQVLGMLAPAELDEAYVKWFADSGLSAIELIDYETGGFNAGLEAAHEYLTQRKEP